MDAQNQGKSPPVNKTRVRSSCKQNQGTATPVTKPRGIKKYAQITILPFRPHL